MNDLPERGLLQQSNARPISGEHLEILGQKAASVWRHGEASTLTDAVVQTVKHAGLSPEQIKRVVEFANTDAFLKEFRKEGEATKVVDFGIGGPADPGDVLRDLNDGGSKMANFNSSDYASPPTEKVSSTISDDDFYSALSGGREHAPEPYAEPYAEALQLRDKLAGAFEHMTSELTGVEGLLQEFSGEVFAQVKQAALNGYSLGEVLRAWHTLAPEPAYVKVAFSFLAPKLLDAGVFPTPNDLTASIEKTGSARRVNPNHSLVTSFGGLCGALEKAAEIQATREELGLALDQIDTFLRKAAGAEAALRSKGLWAAAKETARSAAPKAHDFAAGAAKALVGEESKLPGMIGRAAGSVTEYAPHIGAGLGAYHMYQRAQEMSAHPLARSALSLIPYTDANRQEHARRMMQAAGYDPSTGYAY